MIKKIQLPLLMLILIFSSSCAKKNTAIEETTNVQQQTQQRSPRGSSDQGESRFLAMAKEIGLNDNKTSDFVAIAQKYAAERRTMMQNRSGDREAMRAKMKTMVTNQNNEMKNILNTSQYEKYLSLMQQGRQGRGGAGQRPRRDNPGTGGNPQKQ